MTLKLISSESAVLSGFNEKNIFLTHSLVIEFSAKIVEICRRYQLKTLLEESTLGGRFASSLIRNLLNLSEITFLSVIDILFLLKVFGKCSSKALDFPIICFVIFQVVYFRIVINRALTHTLPHPAKNGHIHLHPPIPSQQMVILTHTYPNPSKKRSYPSTRTHSQPRKGHTQPHPPKPRQ